MCIRDSLEFVARIHGIDFINDSKATNVNSAWYALETMDTPVIWIAGGIDKGNDYSKLIELVSQKVKAIICLGVDNSKIIETFGDKVGAIYETQSMEQAVLTAYTTVSYTHLDVYKRQPQYRGAGNFYQCAGWCLCRISVVQLVPCTGFYGRYLSLIHI